MNENLSAYLNDHLAGSNFAIELLQLLREQYPGKPMEVFAVEMMGQVREDRTFLQNIIDRIGTKASAIQQAVSWIGAKLSELKFTPDPVGTLRALEVLSLGVEGKQLLWQTLSATAAYEPGMQNLSLDNMMTRAKAQRAQIEVQRMLVAQTAFAPVPVPVPVVPAA